MLNWIKKLQGFHSVILFFVNPLTSTCFHQLSNHQLFFIASSQIVFKPPTSQKALSVREIKAEYLGKLVTLQGIVTRVTAVKPFVEVAAYTCELCGTENFQEITSRQYMPMTECGSAACKTNQTKGKLHEQTRANKFLEFQEVKIQELVCVFFRLLRTSFFFVFAASQDGREMRFRLTQR